ncbi:MAG: hypothetical protein KF684_04250 [Phycisphaeraceae bacterium]|nr:hypothetical protein [Phycisphaeraceae bacterium]
MSLFGPNLHTLEQVLAAMPVVIEMTQSVTQAQAAAEIGVPFDQYDARVHYPIFLRQRAVEFLDAIHAGVEKSPKGEDHAASGAGEGGEP